MNNNFNLDELEEFLSDSAEQHRMYPSDKVWRNIDKELHGNKKWPALTFGAIVTGALITAGLILVHPDKNLFSTPEIVPGDQGADHATTKASQEPEKAIIVDFYTRKASGKPSPDYSAFTNSPAATSAADLSSTNSNNNIETNSQQQPSVALNSSLVVDIAKGELPGDPNSEEIAQIGAFDDLQTSLSPVRTAHDLSIAGVNSDFTLNNDLNETAASNTLIQKTAGLPIKSPRKSRWSSFFYITPSISYRYLAETKVSDFNLLSGPIDPYLTHNVNSFVNHKPIGGIELGGGYLYQLSPSLRLRAGLQANVRGYKIEAYSTRNQATAIVLDRGFYSDSILSMSSISNVQGNRPIEINNRYFELSIPLTVDLKVAGFKKLEVYVAGGLQATYQFNSKMYMVSNDYKNYVQSPDLTRQFNVNTSLEAYLSYKAGKLTWQIGPQLRYQLKPGTVKQYPIGEHLFDYGVKVGVVKSLF